MNRTLPLRHDGDDASLLRALAGRAAEEDRTGDGVGQSVDILRQADLLHDSGAADPRRTARRLARIAGVNLSLARLYEGHVNALRIVELHGSAAQGRRVAGLIDGGAFLGVWGAERDRPLQTKGAVLDGAKIYASGLGAVTHAIVTADGPGGRIGLVHVGDAARQSPQDWQMPGMRATRSGGYDFTGLPVAEVDWIGPPGCYGSEPGFVSGVWRIAALQLGAALGLIDAAARRLRSLGRMEAEPQLARLAPIVMRAVAADGLVSRAARFAEGAGAQAKPEHAAALSASARLLTEGLGQDAIAAVEQSVGLGHFEPESETGRIARDLSVYMRQAARDAFLRRVGLHALGREASVWEMLDD